jgi:hypothetical protein
MGLRRPKCERTGTLPHAATMLVAWNLQSGRLWKYSCDEHLETFGGPSYLAARLVGLVDNPSNSQPVHPINSPNPPADELAEIARRENSLATAEHAASPDVAAENRPGSENEAPLEATCVDPECGNPARYAGAWCDECQSRWEDEQRAKAQSMGRPVNMRRGF